MHILLKQELAWWQAEVLDWFTQQPIALKTCHPPTKYKQTWQQNTEDVYTWVFLRNVENFSPQPFNLSLLTSRTAVRFCSYSLRVWHEIYHQWHQWGWKATRWRPGGFWMAETSENITYWRRSLNGVLQPELHSRPAGVGEIFRKWTPLWFLTVPYTTTHLQKFHLPGKQIISNHWFSTKGKWESCAGGNSQKLNHKLPL